MPPPSPSDNDAQTADAADALASVLHILDRFHHRHRNQHRVAKWWVQFTLLRRALRRLDAAILAHQRRLRTSSSFAAAAARARLPKNKNKNTDNGGPRPSRRAPTALATTEAAVTAHARWLVLHVISPAYLAFTQLAADGQHAPLGLLLVALTARLDARLAPLNPTPRSPDAAAAAAATAAAAVVRVASASTPAPESNGDLDLGVAVARPPLAPDVGHDVRRDADSDADPLDSRTSPPRLSPTLSPRRRDPPAATAQLPLSSSSSEPLLNPIPKSKSKSTSKPTSKPHPSVSKPVEPKKKKKKPKGGDEFADLFSSLL
ncbi:hypothetical protein ACHAO5_009232 [Verticillium nonalfalfae]